MMNKGWQDFLDSLSTAGGNIVTLFCCSSITGGLWMWTLHKHATEQAMMAIFGIFSGFTGALLQAQKGNSSKQQMVDRAAVVPTPIVTGSEANVKTP